MFVKGEDRLIYLKVNDIYQPIGCLTSDSFSESSEMLGTTTRDNPNGWKTSIPTNQSFSVSFDGLITKDAVITGLTTYYDLKELKRNRESLEFRLGNEEFFNAIIVSLSDSANIDEFTSFSCSLEGTGVTRNIYDANTFIGGVSSVINTPQLLADKLDIDISIVKNFSIVGDDIKCHILEEYSLGDVLAPNPPFRNTLFSVGSPTYYIDLDGKCNKIVDACFYNSFNTVKFYFPNVLDVGKDQFYHANFTFAEHGLLDIDYIYLPRVEDFGTTVNTDERMFNNTLRTTKIYINDIQETINSGSPDEDLVIGATLGVTIEYLDASDPNFNIKPEDL